MFHLRGLRNVWGIPVKNHAAAVTTSQNKELSTELEVGQLYATRFAKQNLSHPPPNEHMILNHVVLAILMNQRNLGNF